MKKNIGKDFLKKAAAGLIALTLALSGAGLLPGADSKVYASEVETETYYQEHFEDISAYTDGERTAPKPTDAGHRDWLFAGWFQEPACTNTCTATTGEAYAKFVPAGVLSVKCQILAGTTKDSPSDKLRIVSTVDSLDYSRVGFDITINGISRSYISTKVCEMINAKDGGVAFKYTPGEFHEKAKYFITATLVNIPSNAASTGIQITPWWETLDGTKVCGVGAYARVSDAYDNIYNVPIRLYSDEEVAAGYLEVAYNTEVFQYIGMDEGSVFDEMEVRGANGVVRCVGNKLSLIHICIMKDIITHISTENWHLGYMRMNS